MMVPIGISHTFLILSSLVTIVGVLVLCYIRYKFIEYPKYYQIPESCGISGGLYVKYFDSGLIRKYNNPEVFLPYICQCGYEQYRVSKSKAKEIIMLMELSK